MKITLDWVADFLDAPVTPAAAEEALINAGLPLESNEAVDVAGQTLQVLDVEVTSNRSDCLCHVGLARELAALLGRKFRMPDPQVTAPGNQDAAQLTAVEIQPGCGCSYYSARIIQNVKVGPSPDWMVRRLEAIGLRSINNIVDVTNYVMFELGQPLHAFDFDTLQQKRIVVRRARAGEKIVSLDGKLNELDDTMLVIADATHPVAVAGVMGGKETEVTARTRNVLLEAARFDAVTIRNQARKLALMSDSSYRFERGIDPTAAERASRRAAQLIAELGGGTVVPGMVAAGTADRPPIRVTLRLKRIKEVLGIDVPEDRAMVNLAALEFAPAKKGTGDSAVLECTVPNHRLDVEREIDLIEEVARVHGYKHLPVLDRVTHGVQPEPPEEKASRVIAQTMTAAGFFETINITFIHQDEAAAFAPPASSSRAATQVIPLAHQGWKGEVLRPSLLPSLLHVRRTNQNAGIVDARLFEHAEVFWQERDARKNAPTQFRMLGIIGNDVAEVRGAIAAVVERLTSQAKVIVKPKDVPWFTRGIAGEVWLVPTSAAGGGGGKMLGYIGEFSADVQKRYDLRHPAAGAEIDWDTLVAAYERVRRATTLPRFPAVRRDLSVVVGDAVRWADVAAAVEAAKVAFLEEVDFVGTFRNKQIGPGKKSLTLAMEFRDPSTTLRSEQVDEQVKSVVSLLGGKFGAVLRA